jgi:hypothetical protein
MCKSKMTFGVIYEFDCRADDTVKSYQPRRALLRKMQCTEGNENRQYSYLDEEYGDDSDKGPWARGKHRKYCGVFNKEEFEQFIEDCELVASTTETMGSLGAPGSARWYGISPAVSFDADHYGCMASAYVTPYPGFEPKRESTAEKEERWFRMLKAAMVALYGRRGRFTLHPRV